MRPWTTSSTSTGSDNDGYGASCPNKINGRIRHYARMTIDPEAAANFLHDLGPLVLERATQATGAQDAFEKGRAFGLAEVVSLMQEQAAAFQIDLAALGLDGVNPERDLL